MRNIIGHTAKNFADGGVVDKAYGQTLDFLRNANSYVAGKVAAYHIIEKIHIAKAQKAKGSVYYCKRNKPFCNSTDKVIRNKSACPIIIKLLNKVSENFGRGNGAKNNTKAKKARENKPSAYRLCFFKYSCNSFHCAFAVAFCFVHFSAPPV